MSSGTYTKSHRSITSAIRTPAVAPPDNALLAAERTTGISGAKRQACFFVSRAAPVQSRGAHDEPRPVRDRWWCMSEGTAPGDVSRAAYRSHAGSASREEKKQIAKNFQLVECHAFTGAVTITVKFEALVSKAQLKRVPGRISCRLR